MTDREKLLEKIATRIAELEHLRTNLDSEPISAIQKGREYDYVDGGLYELRRLGKEESPMPTQIETERHQLFTLRGEVLAALDGISFRRRELSKLERKLGEFYKAEAESERKLENHLEDIERRLGLDK